MRKSLRIDLAKSGGHLERALVSSDPMKLVAGRVQHLPAAVVKNC